MRLFTLAIVAGLGVLIGVGLYVFQMFLTPANNEKICARVESSVSAAEPSNEKTSEVSQAVSVDHKIDTSTLSAEEIRSQLPDAFQFPQQHSQPIAVQTTPVVDSQVPSVTPKEAELAVETTTRPDTPVTAVSQSAAPEAIPVSLNNKNGNIKLETAAGKDGGSARTKFIVNK